MGTSRTTDCGNTSEDRVVTGEGSQGPPETRQGDPPQKPESWNQGQAKTGRVCGGVSRRGGRGERE